MSDWGSIRNAIEYVFNPLATKAVTFAETLENDVEGAEVEDIEAAFASAAATYEVTPGTFEVKALAALTVFGTTLLGDAVTVVKTAASQTAAENTVPVAPAS